MLRKVMDGHNGHVEFETDANAGTTFLLYFPAIPVMQRIALQSARLGLGGTVPSKVLSEAKLVTPATIFLIDDQEDVLETITILLRRDGHDVHPFSDPRLAITSLNLRRPDLVITDLSMPHLNGWEVARLARESWEGLPVVLLTSKPDAVDNRRRGRCHRVRNGAENVVSRRWAQRCIGRDRVRGDHIDQGDSSARTGHARCTPAGRECKPRPGRISNPRRPADGLRNQRKFGARSAKPCA